MVNGGFAQNREEAEERFGRYVSTDPFPDIAPALLNSADIYDYVRETGMVYPFDDGGDSLKSASYEIPFLGDVFFWENETRQNRRIEKGDSFTLQQNSIGFIWLQTVIQLPDYIALRFNFRIQHVHRGLLLGTGPMVDPGFVGRILIPFHNLTSEDYTINGGDGLIWAEFTKLSPNKRWDPGCKRSDTNLRSFPPDRKNRDPSYYFQRASGHHPIQSSIPGAIKRARDDADAAKQSAEKAAANVTWLRNFIAALSFLAAIALVATFYDLLSGVNATIQATNARLDSLVSRLSVLEAKKNPLGEADDRDAKGKSRSGGSRSAKRDSATKDSSNKQ